MPAHFDVLSRARALLQELLQQYEADVADADVAHICDVKLAWDAALSAMLRAMPQEQWRRARVAEMLVVESVAFRAELRRETG